MGTPIFLGSLNPKPLIPLLGSHSTPFPTIMPEFGPAAMDLPG